MAFRLRQTWSKICCCRRVIDDNGHVGRNIRPVLLGSIFVFFVIGVLVFNSPSMTPPLRTTFNIMLNGHQKQVSGVFRRAYEVEDGSVNVVFNIANGAKDLIKVNSNNTGIDKEVLTPKKENSTIRSTRVIHTRSVESEPPRRMAYPLTIGGDFVINSHRLCRPGEILDYLIVVHSATAYLQRRQAIRQTYAAKRLFGKMRQAIVFLLGLTEDPVMTKKIREEAINYGDIVQGNFIDSYHNLTHKGVMGYRWIVEHCPRAKLIIKIDDDVFFNPFRLIDEVIPTFHNKTHQIACHVRPRDTSPIVRGKGVWQVKDTEFKGLHYFPFTYCNGYFVVISAELIQPMLQAVRLNPFFWIDDVYLFGILPATVGNVTFQSLRKNLTLVFNTGRDCYATNGLNCQYLAVAQWRVGDKTTLWHMLMELLPGATKKEYDLIDNS